MTTRADLKDALTPAAAIGIPAAWAGVSGAIGASLAGSLAIVNSWDAPAAVAAFAGTAAAGAAWIYGLNWWGARVREIIGSEPQPQLQAQAVETYRLAITWNEGAAGEWLDDFGVDWERLRDWLIAAYGGRSLGENHWTGSRGAFSKGEYHVMIDRAQEKGLIRLRSRHYSSGYEMTAKGRAIAAELTRRYPPSQAPHPAGRLSLARWPHSREG